MATRTFNIVTRVAHTFLLNGSDLNYYVNEKEKAGKRSSILFGQLAL